MNIESRLERLESENRTLKIVALASLVVAVLPLAMGSDEATKEDVRAKRFTLVDNEGSPLGTWAYDQGTKTVSFRIESGDGSVILASSTEQSSVRLVGGVNPRMPRFAAPKQDEADIAMTAGRDDRTIKVNDGDVIVYQDGKPTFMARRKASIFPAARND